MTGPEMISQFKFGFEVMASGQAPGFEDSEIYSILNRAYDSLIEQLISEKNYALLQAIINVDSLSLTSLSGYKYYSVSLPTTYWRYVDSFTRVNKTIGDTTTGFLQVTSQTNAYMQNTLVSVYEWEKVKTTEYNQYFVLKNPVVYIQGDSIFLYIDQYTTPTAFFLTHVRKRADISGSVDCELDISLHRKIVNLAIDIAKDIINTQTPQQNR